jgi:2-phospho-L-lactate transferase/gluconeogenesis factor (CofD/UPF0052 family)
MTADVNLLSAVTNTKKSMDAVQKSRINLVLFSGGSGTKSITEALMRHPQISLTILINTYDDGLSTGRLRRFIPGMLGPSDVRKNINRIMPASERPQKSLKSVSDYRLPVGISRNDALAILQSIVHGEYSLLPEKLASTLPQFVAWQLQRFNSFLATFLSYFEEQEAQGRTFDFTDCALGNLLFAGCYLEQGRDFNRTVEAFCEFYETGANMLLNITQGENLFLVARKENGTLLLNEADIVAAQDASKISELFLVEEETYLKRVEHQPEPAGGWEPLIRAAHRVPRLNPRAGAALAAADVIIYGPGTQHSSLFPSYMTDGVAEQIVANTGADKVFIGNIHRDSDIQADDASDLARKLLDSMTRKGQTHVEWTSVVSHFFVQDIDENTLSRGNYIPFDKSRFTFPLETVKVRDWESQEGRHSGGYVVEELRQIVQSRIDIELAQVHHMVSIVIPVLDEEATIELVLKSVTALDFSPFELSKEVIVIDGGSSDRTVERARQVKNVKVYHVSPSETGRGAAMRLGLEKSRGNLIVFFPGDDEYRPEDLYSIVSNMVNSKFRAVFGTRAVKCTDLSNRLIHIYNNNRWLYLISKYGGIMISVVTLLLYNRYVSDVLSSVKGYDAHLLRSLNLKSNGLDLDAEIVAKLSERREYIMELPVEYKPRNREAGKKIRTSDGLRVLTGLLRFKKF